MTTLAVIQGEATSVDDRVRAVVRVCLAAVGMKPVDLAERLGLSKHQVWDRLRGDRAFTVQEVADMAAVFEIPVEVFIKGPSALIQSARGSTTGHQGNRIPGVSQPVATPFPRLRAVA